MTDGEKNSDQDSNEKRQMPDTPPSDGVDSVTKDARDSFAQPDAVANTVAQVKEKIAKKKLTKKQIIIGVVILIVILGAVGGNGNKGDQNDSANTATATSEQKVEKKTEEKVEKKVDKSILQASINQWQGLQSGDYTAETWQGFSSALDAAKKVNDNQNASQNDVDEANKALVSAHSGLKEAFKAENYQWVSYKDVARNPDSYKGKKLAFKGKVLQVVEGSSETDLRVATNGAYDDIVFVGFDPSIMGGTRVLEDDMVTVYGVCVGQYSYQSTLGGQISLPGLMAEKVEIN